MSDDSRLGNQQWERIRKHFPEEQPSADAAHQCFIDATLVMAKGGGADVGAVFIKRASVAKLVGRS
jgi:hypothetical protein